MTGSQRRTVALSALVVVVGAAVAVDRLSAGATGAGEPTVRERSVQRAALVAEKRAFIDAEPRWRAALDRARDEWDRVRARLIVAPTAELATARLGQLIRGAADDFGLTLEATGTPSVRAPGDDTSLRVIGLRLSLRATGPGSLAAYLDRLERLPGAWINVTSLSVLGPGRTPSAGLRVDLEIEALAWVGTEPAP